jgi:Spy/CpxP family protein refolding chaperone
MKINNLNFGKVMLLITLAFIAINIQAQRGYYGMPSDMRYSQDSMRQAHNRLNLTDDQEKKISELRTANQKEMMAFRNDMAITEAELQKYRSADKPDMTQINKTIDEIGKLRTDMQKKRVSHELAVRNLLTEEQKAIYDTRRGSMAQGFGKDMNGYRGKNDGPGKSPMRPGYPNQRMMRP